VLVVEESVEPPASERERATAALRAAGLLAELSPEEKARAAASTATLEEVSAILARGDGPSLSEIVLEMRGTQQLLRFKMLDWSAWPEGSTFSREDLYDDDER
jgi:hypothetical protein